MAAAEPVSGVSAERLPLSRHEILHYLRGEQESAHRRGIWHRSAMYTYVSWKGKSLTDPSNMREMELEEANDYCNRTAPFYILRNDLIVAGAD